MLCFALSYLFNFSILAWHFELKPNIEKKKKQKKELYAQHMYAIWIFEFHKIYVKHIDT